MQDKTSFLKDERLDELDLPEKVEEEARDIYEKASEKNVLLGYSSEDAAASVLYTSCRKVGTYRPLDDFIKLYETDRKRVSQSYKKIVRRLNLKIPPFDIPKCIHYLLKKLDLLNELEDRSLELFEKINTKDIAYGKNPFSISAAIVYLACKVEDVKITQNMIAEAAGVSSVTLRSRLKEIESDFESTES